MEPITTVLTALGYIAKSLSQTKATKNAENELTGKFWNWLKPKIIKDVPEIEAQHDKPATRKKAKAKLQQLSKDDKFLEELKQHIAVLQKAGIKEKNIVEADLEGYDDVHIGDDCDTSAEGLDRKNVFKGSASGGKTFHVGDKK